MKKTLASLLAVLAFTLAIAQTGVPGEITTSFVQTRDYNPANPTANIYRPCMLYLPAGYQGVMPGYGPPYHLLVYIHGAGDVGPADGSEVNELLSMGPLKMLNDETWDGTGMYTTSCSPTEFMVFAFQTSDLFVSHDELEYALRQLSERFFFETIIFTGASAGGERTVSYALDLTRSFRPSHIVPMSVYSVDNTNLATVAQSGMKMWAFVPDQSGSSYHTTTTTLVTNFNTAQSGSAILTAEPQGGPGGIGSHCCWDVFYNPSFRRNDGTGDVLNIYEWISKQAQYAGPQPPFYTCPSWIGMPYKFAGYLTVSYTDKIGACNANCTIRAYTEDGNITQGSVIWSPDYWGTGTHFGFSTIKEKNRPANKHLVIDSYGEVTVFEGCGSPAGYVAAPDAMTATCSRICSTAVYTTTGTVDASSTLLDASGAAFNGNWQEWGYSTTLNGTAQKKLGIQPDGKIYNHENCGGGRFYTPGITTSQEENNTTLRLFPNPTNKQLFIQLNNSRDPVQVQLYNMSGVLVYTARITSSMHVITTSNFAKGVYQLKLSNKNGIIKTEKIIIHSCTWVSINKRAFHPEGS